MTCINPLSLLSLAGFGDLTGSAVAVVSVLLCRACKDWSSPSSPSHFAKTLTLLLCHTVEKQQLPLREGGLSLSLCKQQVKTSRTPSWQVVAMIWGFFTLSDKTASCSGSTRTRHSPAFISFQGEFGSVLKLEEFGFILFWLCKQPSQQPPRPPRGLIEL